MPAKPVIRNLSHSRSRLGNFSECHTRWGNSTRPMLLNDATQVIAFQMICRDWPVNLMRCFRHHSHLQLIVERLPLQVSYQRTACPWEPADKCSAWTTNPVWNSRMTSVAMASWGLSLHPTANRSLSYPSRLLPPGGFSRKSCGRRKKIDCGAASSQQVSFQSSVYTDLVLREFQTVSSRISQPGLNPPNSRFPFFFQRARGES